MAEVHGLIINIDRKVRTLDFENQAKHINTLWRKYIDLGMKWLEHIVYVELHAVN